jgi:hypothetical protein
MALITFVDFGKDRDFSCSIHMLDKIVNNSNAFTELEDPGDIKWIQSRNRMRTYNAIVDTDSIIHAAGHGESSGLIGNEFLKIFRRYLDVHELTGYLIETDQAITPDLVIVDACSSASKTWQRQISKILMPGHAALFIGTNRDIPFATADFFFQAFYLSLFSQRYPKSRTARLNRIRKAYEVAKQAEKFVSKDKSYFEIFELVGR